MPFGMTPHRPWTCPPRRLVQPLVPRCSLCRCDSLFSPCFTPPHPRLAVPSLEHSLFSLFPVCMFSVCLALGCSLLPACFGCLLSSGCPSLHCRRKCVGHYALCNSAGRRLLFLFFIVMSFCPGHKLPISTKQVQAYNLEIILNKRR